MIRLTFRLLDLPILKNTKTMFWNTAIQLFFFSFEKCWQAMHAMHYNSVYVLGVHNRVLVSTCASFYVTCDTWCNILIFTDPNFLSLKQRMLQHGQIKQIFYLELLKLFLWNYFNICLYFHLNLLLTADLLLGSSWNLFVLFNGRTHILIRAYDFF
jgi:hypothetical protein